jgi:hypothetical protein
MDSQLGQIASTETSQSVQERPVYEAPRVTVMDEADVLKTFQFTSAAITWWMM